MLFRHLSFWSALVGAGTLLVAPLAVAEGLKPGKACKADLE